jgi:hypothetical protein
MVKILADSLNVATGDRITTFQIDRFPYLLLAEVGTHRILNSDGMDEPITERLNPFGQEFARNSGSSRAIPIQKVIDRVKADPYIPIFTKKQKGMQGKVGDRIFQVSGRHLWLKALDEMIKIVESMEAMGMHKQNANHLLKPWMYVPIIVTGTEWKNFFNLRCDEKTHPDFQKIAKEMKSQYDANKPDELHPGQWHIPMSEGLAKSHGSSIMKFKDALKVATARHARLSYATHDGEFSFDRDVSLHDGLVKDEHKSPFEHSAMAVDQKIPGYPEYAEIETGDAFYVVNTRNYRGFYSYRGHLEDSIDV